MPNFGSLLVNPAALAAISSMRNYTRNQAPMNAAVAQSQRDYPRFAQYPATLTTGIGPGSSETYPPNDPTNPVPGKWNVQLRDPQVINNDRASWPDRVSLEMIHALQANDPVYQVRTQQFINSMTPDQKAESRFAFQKDQQEFPEDKGRDFNEWMNQVQSQEYLRGMLFPKVIPNWIGPNGEGQYTPQQMNMGNLINGYLRGR